MRRGILILALVAACSSDTGTGTGGTEASSGTDSGQTATATATGGSSTNPGETESATGTGGTTDPVWPQACSDLYDPAIVPTFELTFSDTELQGLQSDCDQGLQNYRPVEFSYNGETVAAMARLKGNWSFSCDKYQFVISFNEQDPNGRFHGLRKIVLDAPWYDQSLLHERMAFPLFESLGLPYSCVNNARLLLNGSYYGAYSNVERIDKEYLQRSFEEPGGNLYEGGVELKTNELADDTTNRDALFAATTVQEIDALMDLDQAVAEWAAEAMLPAMDNYWAGVEINYYLYDHPSRGFVYLPYDLDIAFGDAAYPDGELLWPDTVSSDPITYQHPGWEKEAIVQLVLGDSHWCERFVEELVKARAAYEPQVMADRVDEWADQIAQAVADDPNRPFSNTDHQDAIAELRTFFAERAAFVDAWLAVGGHCPAQW